MSSTTSLPSAITNMFAAINARDVDALAGCFTQDVSYQLLVPHPAVVGRKEVVAALSDSFLAADRVRWDVLTWSATGNLVFVERVDRFWFDEKEATIECTGVFELRSGAIAVARDYADLDTWRRRKSLALGE